MALIKHFEYQLFMEKYFVDGSILSYFRQSRGNIQRSLLQNSRITLRPSDAHSRHRLSPERIVIVEQSESEEVPRTSRSDVTLQAKRIVSIDRKYSWSAVIDSQFHRQTCREPAKI